MLMIEKDSLMLLTVSFLMYETGKQPPVKMINFDRFSSMKLIIVAIEQITSKPHKTIKASYFL